MQFENNLKPHQSSLVWAGVASVVLWAVPFLGFVLLPLEYLNTHLHEFCHAITMALTGGEIEFIRVFASGGGVTLGSGSPVLVSSAGYVGATIIGALLLQFGSTEKGAAIALRAVALVLLFSLIFWVRGDVVGIISGLFWTAILIALPSLLKARTLVFAAQFVGIQQCLASVKSLYILLNISAFQETSSDAMNLQEFTGVPAIFWALLWTAIGVTAVVVTLRSVWSPSPPRRR